MNSYNVYVPITGVLTITVKASDEEEAKEIALDSQFNLEVDNAESHHIELNEFEMHKQICRGNVFHGCMNEIDVELVEEYEENEEENEIVSGELIKDNDDES